LLRTALSISKKIEIGLTSDDLLKNKEFSERLEAYDTRKKSVEAFISSFTDMNRVNIVKIKTWEDMVGYVLQPEYEGLIVSQETYDNAVKLSETREKKNLAPLIIIVIPLIKDDSGEKISSTERRKKLGRKNFLD